MADVNTIQIGTDVGLSLVVTIAAGIASTTWWFSRLIKSLGDSQTAMKEELTASQVKIKEDLSKDIIGVSMSQDKRGGDLDRGIVSVQAALTSHSSLIEQKMTSIQVQMTDFSTQVREMRQETNGMRERVVRLETIADHPTPHR
jgi:hypothetical protein